MSAWAVNVHVHPAEACQGDMKNYPPQILAVVPTLICFWEMEELGIIDGETRKGGRHTGFTNADRFRNTA
jgi:hypothetical protein